MKIAICAALYEAGRPFLADFSAAVGAAAAHYDTIFVAAVDGLLDAKNALSGVAAELDTVTVDVARGHTPAGVRRAMLAAGQESGADILVFIDMDDVIAPAALDSHLDALADADISYGDLELIDAGGAALGRRFFENAGIPDKIEGVDAIRDRNFLGFSNTAVRANRIAPAALTMPDDIVAADWWFFTMLLLGGLHGKKTKEPVAAYRIHGANTLGVVGPQTAAEAIGQTEALLRHYRAFSAHPELASRAAATEKILVELRRAPVPELEAHLCASSEIAGAWFESIGRIANHLNAASPAGAVAT